MHEALQSLARLLREQDDISLAAMVEKAISGPQDEQDAFLKSNDLWGGMGSIADQAGMRFGPRDEGRREIERALIHLGNQQIQAGKVNLRTEMWVRVFEKWNRDGL